VGGAAQGDCAERQPSRRFIQSSNDTNADIYLNPFKAAAASFGLEAVVAPVHNVSDLEFAVAEQARTPNAGLIVIQDRFLTPC
jgi:hypothetical protein